MKILPGCVLVLSLVLPVFAESGEADQSGSAEETVRRLEAEIRVLRATVKALAEENKVLKAEVERFRSLQDATESPPAPEPKKPEGMNRPTMPLVEFLEPLALGHAAPVKRIRVVQIQGERDLLAEMPVKLRNPKEKTIPFTSGRQWQIITHEDTLVWIRGLEASGWVDRQDVKLEKILIVSGTKTYETQAGQRTVFLLEPATDKETAIIDREIKRLERIERAKTPNPRGR